MLLWKVAGVRIKVNILWLLLCAVYCALGYKAEVLIIFSSVLVHEIAHVATALALGVKVSEIELLPFGGQAKIEDFTGLEPDKEIYTAITGPVVSLTMAGIFFWFSNQINPAYQSLFININLFLGIFNLCPALPLDGGRILRAWWSGRIGYKKATSRTASFGKVLAVVLGLAGVYEIYGSHSQGVNYLLIGFMLFWSAHRESKLLAYAFMRYLVNKKGVLSSYGAMSSQAIISRPDTRLKTILDLARPNYYLLVVMVDENDHPVRMHGEAELIEVYFNQGPGVLLKDC